MVVAGFMSATRYTDLIISVLFFPLFIYFASRVFPRRSKAIDLPKEVVLTKVEMEESGQVTKLKKEGVDIDRRNFLKLIGTAGLSLFIFSMFTKKAEAAFFGSVPGPGTVSIKDSSGNKIDPAEKKPMDGYSISEIDDSVIAYYGFTNKTGNWFIMQEDTDTGAFRYIKGSSSFSTNWTNRESLTYDYFDNIF